MTRPIKPSVHPDPAMQLGTRAIMARLDATIKGQRFSEVLVAAYTAGLKEAATSAAIPAGPKTAAAGDRATQRVVGGLYLAKCVARATDP